MIKKKLNLNLPDEILNKIESFYSNNSFPANKKKILKLYNPIVDYMVKVHYDYTALHLIRNNPIPYKRYFPISELFRYLFSNNQALIYYLSYSERDMFLLIKKDMLTDIHSHALTIITRQNLFSR